MPICWRRSLSRPSVWPGHSVGVPTGVTHAPLSPNPLPLPISIDDELMASSKKDAGRIKTQYSKLVSVKSLLDDLESAQLQVRFRGCLGRRRRRKGFKKHVCQATSLRAFDSLPSASVPQMDSFVMTVRDFDEEDFQRRVVRNLVSTA